MSKALRLVPFVAKESIERCTNQKDGRFVYVASVERRKEGPSAQERELTWQT